MDDKEIGKVRIYGEKPYTVVLVHGGPGAPGEMKPVALELAKTFGVLEPFQTKDSINGQVEELKTQIIQYSKSPVVLIGWSWGAWLAYIFASKHPDLVKKLVLISSGPFEVRYIPRMRDVRLSHLTVQEQQRIAELEELFTQENLPNKDALFEEYGGLYSKADTYESNGEDANEERIKPQLEIYNHVWPEAAKLRETGELLTLGKSIKCDVVAIQGRYDPHIYEGVKEPLGRILKNFKFILIEKCGHHPWYEKYAKDNFYDVLQDEISQG